MVEFFVILFACAIAMKSAQAPSKRDYIRWKRMYNDFNDLRDRIEYCPTTVELDDIYNEAIELFSKHSRIKNVNDYCGRLHAAIENKRVALRKERIRA